MARKTIDKSGPLTNARAHASPDCPTEPVSTARAVDTRGVQSEGQRLLREISASLAEVAAAVGCSSRQAVGNWRNGTASPGAAYRAKLAEVYGIPEASWGQRPVGAMPAPETDEPAPAADASPTTMAGVLVLMEMARERMEDEALLEAERAKWAAEFSRALALKARLEKEAEMLEDRIVREHPMWKRLKRAIVKSLVPFPGAAKAVALALKELDSK